MGVAVLAARLVLAGVFVSAAAAKQFDRRGTEEGMVAFGVPRAVAPVFAVVVPVAELAIGLLLIPPESSAVAGVAALVLLAAFTAAILANVARGRTPACACFGQARGGRADGRAVARNLVLAGLAAWVVAGSNWSAADGWALPFGLAVIAFAVTWGAAGARRRVPVQPGDAVPGGADRPLLLVFVDRACTRCDALLDDVAAWREEDAFDVVVEEDARVAARYGVPGTPSAIAIRDGRVAAPMASGASAIRALAGSLSVSP